MFCVKGIISQALSMHTGSWGDRDEWRAAGDDISRCLAALSTIQTLDPPSFLPLLYTFPPGGYWDCSTSAVFTERASAGEQLSQRFLVVRMTQSWSCGCAYSSVSFHGILPCASVGTLREKERKKRLRGILITLVFSFDMLTHTWYNPHICVRVIAISYFALISGSDNTHTKHACIMAIWSPWD